MYADKTDLIKQHDGPSERFDALLGPRRFKVEGIYSGAPQARPLLHGIALQCLAECCSIQNGFIYIELRTYYYYRYYYVLLLLLLLLLSTMRLDVSIYVMCV